MSEASKTLALYTVQQGRGHLASTFIPSVFRIPVGKGHLRILRTPVLGEGQNSPKHSTEEYKPTYHKHTGVGETLLQGAQVLHD